MRQAIVDAEVVGRDPAYHVAQLAHLEDLSQFLKMSWDQWLDQLECRTVTEVSQ